jgi:hypothetical protein
VHSLATSLAASRMEQLRALRFEFDSGGARVTDLATDVSVEPASLGGSGLAVSGGAALDSDVPGHVDFLNRNGTWLGNGSVPPAGTSFVRRWAIEATDASGDLLVLQVLVRPVESGSASGSQRVAGEVRLVTLRARTRR